MYNMNMHWYLYLEKRKGGYKIQITVLDTLYHMAVKCGVNIPSTNIHWKPSVQRYAGQNSTQYSVLIKIQKRVIKVSE